MASLSGRRVGAFDIGPLLGAGGMGEVYRGRDTRLNRDVAIKVLLAAVAGDSERLARFNREAQVLASLNHPNIAHIHGVDEGESGPLLILEFVDGPTLADRIARGPLPVDESVAIAKQIADALEAAHERGIVHRDLKPANIKVDDQGNVKVLDFGLAKAFDQRSGIGDQGSGTLANSPTITSPAMTQAGMILGTAAYMSPEQAKGRAVDKRSDVWAFGCVLYEMLAGRRAFEGEDVTDTIAAVVRGEPDWSKLPAATPPQIRLLLNRCLEKDRRTRISDIGVARFLMNETIDGAAPVSAPPRSSRRAVAVGAAGLILGAALVGVPWAFALRTAPAAPALVRFLVTPSAERPLVLQGNDRDIAMAPDGSFVVYRSADASAMQPTLMLRRVGEIDASELPGTTGARQPIISPDGQWVAFVSGGELRKAPISGGGSSVICRVDGIPRGIDWSDDGTIVYASRAGLMRVPAGGGDPSVLLAGDEASGVIAFASPHSLPGGRTILFAANGPAALTQTRIEALDVASGTRKVLVPSASAPSYVAPGYLVFGTATSVSEAIARSRGTLRAVRFDPSRVETSGDPLTLIEPVTLTAVGAVNYSVSRRGDFVYVPGGAGNSSARPRSLVWVDRHGRETPIAAPVRAYAMGRISPDGTKIALDVRDQTNDIWVWDIDRQTLAMLNRDPGQDMSPLWTPDSRRIIWGSTRHGGNPNLFGQAADGTGSPEQLTNHPTNQFPTSISPDGRTVVLFGASGTSQMDIFTVALDSPDRKAQPLISTPGFDFGAELSPDGKWLAYHSNDSGEAQVYVRPFPNVNDSRTQISSNGGSRAAWSRDGHELFYADRDGFLTSVAVRVTGSTFSAAAPTKLLETKYYLGFSVLGLDLRAYDVAPDGKRFLMLKDVEGEARPEAAKIVVMLNGATELKQRLPVP